MTRAVQELLKSFDALSDLEKRQAAAEVLRRTMLNAPPVVSDDALTEAADTLFLDLDAGEEADARLTSSNGTARPKHPTVPALRDLLAKITKENIHGETNTGPAKGNEAL